MVILKKPYAFLIKHFKLIHLIMTLLMLVLLYQTYILSQFFNDFIASSQVILNNDVTTTLMGNYIYILISLVIIISITIFFLMSFKDKPRIYYVLNIVGYILLAVLYSYTIRTIGDMQNIIVDFRITRAIRDFLNLILVFQIYTFSVSLIRSIGIDLKKFDFKEDALELGLAREDSEEFEVNIEFDSQTLKRNIRHQYRSFKDYFKENKIILLSILLIIISFLSFKIVSSINNTTKKYSMNQVFSVSGFNLKINDSYLLKNTNETDLVVVKFNIKSFIKNNKFIFGKLALKVGNNKYYHNNKYASKVNDLGVSYLKQEINDSWNEFILIYEIPSNLSNSSMNLVYTEQLVQGMFTTKTDDKIIPIKINNLKNLKEDKEIQLNQKYVVGEGILSGKEFTINSVDLDSRFKINYKICINSNECYMYYEIVEPEIIGNSDNAVLRINANIVSSNDDGKVVSFIDFIKDYGYIYYEKDGVEKQYSVSNKINITHNDDNYYFIVNKDILDSKNVKLVLNARNQKYILNIK